MRFPIGKHGFGRCLDRHDEREGRPGARPMKIAPVRPPAKKPDTCSINYSESVTEIEVPLYGILACPIDDGVFA
jgi:hypothetical protein